MSKWEEILVLLAEGGSISVMGKKGHEGTWSYSLIRGEETLAQLTDDVLPEDAYSETIANSWDDLLALLDKYPWIKLYPKTTHREFKKQVLAAVIARTSDAWLIEKWEEACMTGPKV